MTAPDLHDGSTYRDATFRGLRLDGALRDATFHDCVFDGCDLHEAQLLGCRFVDCDLLGCDLALLDVRGTAFLGVTIEHGHAPGINWSAARVGPNEPFELDVKESVLNFGRFVDLELRRRRFEGCTIHEALFERCDLTDASFRGSDLSGSEFVGCDLTGADLRKARGYRIDARRNTVTGLHAWPPEAVGLLHGMGIALEEPSER
ncbi:MAG: pentapeptide repeat-containing protein [Trueperaceae bacterium]|nr:pentapeptide repeat-containing protein [Trueperaceae bacterium]